MGFDPISLAIEGGVALAKGLIGSHAAKSAANTQQTAATNAAAAYAPIAAGAVPAYQRQLAMYNLQTPMTPVGGQPRTAPPGVPVAGTAVPTTAQPTYGIAAAPPAAGPQPYSLASLTMPVTPPVTTGSSYGR